MKIKRIASNLFSLFIFPVLIAASASGDVTIDLEETPTGEIPVDDEVLDRNQAYIVDEVAVTFGFDTDGDGITDVDALFEQRGNDGTDGYISTFGTETSDSERQDSPESLGEFSLTGNLANGVLGDFWIDYDTDVENVSGEIWDIDAFINFPLFEQWRVTAFDREGREIASTDSPQGLAFDNPASLDSLAWVFSLESENIRRVRIRPIGTSENHQIGFLFDNIKADVSVLIGDVNCDGVIDLLDVDPFVQAIEGRYNDKADINQDGFVDLLDVAPFVDLLTAG
ncbi:MAG: dockerin type I domain-containing protein [Planctomycetota bacterium]